MEKKDIDYKSSLPNSKARKAMAKMGLVQVEGAVGSYFREATMENRTEVFIKIQQDLNGEVYYRAEFEEKHKKRPYALVTINATDISIMAFAEHIIKLSEKHHKTPNKPYTGLHTFGGNKE